MGATTNQCIPYYEPATRLTCHAKAAVTGKTFVVVSDDRHATTGLIQVSPASAAGQIFGVAGWDAAIDEEVTVLRGPLIVPVTAGEAISANDEIEVGTAGVAMTLADGIAVGRAVADADMNGDCQVALYAAGGLAASGFATDDHTHD